jgi:hypothetical protein
MAKWIEDLMLFRLDSRDFSKHPVTKEIIHIGIYTEYKEKSDRPCQDKQNT